MSGGPKADAPPDLSIVVCTRDPAGSAAHERALGARIGCTYEYVAIDHSAGRRGLCAAYNEGVRRSRGAYLAFVHDDVRIETAGWGRLLLDKFRCRPDVGLIGAIGTRYLSRFPQWDRAGPRFIRGRVRIELADGAVHLAGSRSPDGDDDVVAVDGMFFVIPRPIFGRVRFDQDLFDGFHFYDLDICMQVATTHRLQVTTDITFWHDAGSRWDDSWFTAAAFFAKKWAARLPASCDTSLPEPERR